MYGCCTFTVAGPAAWNSLRGHLPDPDVNVVTLRYTMKTFFCSDIEALCDYASIQIDIAIDIEINVGCVHWLGLHCCKVQRL